MAAFVIEAAKKGLPVYTVDQIPAYDTYGNLLPEAFKESVQETILEELPVRIRKEAGSYATVLTDSDAQNTVHDLRLYQTAHGDARVIMLFNESTTKSISGTIVFEKTKKPLLSAVQYSPWSNTAEHFGILENKLSILLAPGEAQFSCWKQRLAAVKEDKNSPRWQWMRTGRSVAVMNCIMVNLNHL